MAFGPNLYTYMLTARLNEQQRQEQAFAEAMANNLREQRNDLSQQRLDLEKEQLFAREKSKAAKTAGLPAPEFEQPEVQKYGELGGMESDAAVAGMLAKSNLKNKEAKVEHMIKYGRVHPEAADLMGMEEGYVPTVPESQAASDVWESHRRKQRALAPRSGGSVESQLPGFFKTVRAWQTLRSKPDKDFMSVEQRNSAHRLAALADKAMQEFTRNPDNYQAIMDNMLRLGQSYVDKYGQGPVGYQTPWMKDQGPIGGQPAKAGAPASVDSALDRLYNR